MKDKLTNGQKQLILEHLQKNCFKLTPNDFGKTQISSWFYKKRKSLSLSQLDKHKNYDSSSYNGDQS